MTYNFGNKCGHSPDKPRLHVRPLKYSKTLFILKNATEQAKNWYFNPRKLLQNLQYIRAKDSRRRSESREAISSVIGVMLDHIDLLDGSINQFTRNGKKNMTVSQIANEANIGYKRCLRAIKALKEARYLTIDYVHKVTTKGKWYLEPRIKRLQRRLLVDLGIKRRKIEMAITSLYKKSSTFVSEATSRLQFLCVKNAQRIIKNGKAPHHLSLVLSGTSA